LFLGNILANHDHAICLLTSRGSVAILRAGENGTIAACCQTP
jgi:hypothetical protein